MSEKLIPDPTNFDEPAVQLDNGADEPQDPNTVRTISASYRKKVYAGMWGPLEITVAGIAAFLLLVTLACYLFFVVPAENQLEEGRAKRDELERELQSARAKWGDIQDTESQVAKLLISAEDFEFRALKEESIGTTSVYQRINVLINAYGLRNTSGPDYVPLDTGDAQQAQQARQRNAGTQRGRDKYKSLFPGIYITTTVEGSYTDLRRFIRDIETSQEFVAITSVELEPADEQEKKADTQAVQVTGPGGQKTVQNIRKGQFRGKTVSLRIEMAAYFRRPADQRLNLSVPRDAAAPAGGTD